MNMKSVENYVPVRKNNSSSYTKRLPEELIAIYELASMYAFSSFPQPSKLFCNCIRDLQNIYIETTIYGQNKNSSPIAQFKKVIILIPYDEKINYRKLITSNIIDQHNSILIKNLITYQKSTVLQDFGNHGNIPCKNADINTFSTYFKAIYIIVNCWLLNNSKDSRVFVPRELMPSNIMINWRAIKPYFDMEENIYRTPVGHHRVTSIHLAALECKKAIGRHQQKCSANIPKHPLCTYLKYVTICQYESIPQDLLKGIFNAFVLLYPRGQQRPVEFPSHHWRHWYFRNITQGFRISVILRNIDVNTFNVMRKFYFVLITTDAPVLNIEVHLALRTEMLITDNTHYIASGFSTISSISWSQDHRHILKKYFHYGQYPSYLSPIHNLDKSMQVLAAITYLKPECTQSGSKTHAEVPSTDELEVLCPDYYAESDSKVSISTSSSVASVTSVRKNSTLVSLFLALEHFLGNKRNALAGKTLQSYLNVNSLFDNNIVAYSKLWLKNVVSDAINVGENLKSEVNETLFDNIYGLRHQYIQCIHQFSPHVYCKTFLKYLGNSLLQYFLFL